MPEKRGFLPRDPPTRPGPPRDPPGGPREARHTDFPDTPPDLLLARQPLWGVNQALRAGGGPPGGALPGPKKAWLAPRGAEKVLKTLWQKT